MHAFRSGSREDLPPSVNPRSAIAACVLLLTFLSCAPRAAVVAPPAAEIESDRVLPTSAAPGGRQGISRAKPVVDAHQAPRQPAPFDSPQRQVDFARMRFEATFTQTDMDARTMHACVTHQVRARELPITELTLDCAGPQIESVEVGAAREAAAFQIAENKLRIDLARALSTEDTCAVRIRYTVRDAKLGLLFSGDRDEFVIYTNAEPLQARYWLPCHDWPDTRFAGCDVSITVPDAFNVVSVGARRGIEATDSGKRYDWSLDTPIDPHLFGFVVGKLTELRDPAPGVPVSIFVHADDADAARTCFVDSPRIIAHFGKLLGEPYPYPAFSHVSVPGHFHGGMEHAGFDMIAPTMFRGAAGDNDRTRYEYVAHMIAHAWFAGLVNYAHITEAWLNEGFASYFHMLWRLENEGEQAFQKDMRAARDRVARFDHAGKSHPIVNTRIPAPGDIYQFGAGLVYFKGAWVLHMLRNEIGEDAFWRGVRHFLNSNRGRGVVTSDLRAAFEFSSVRDLGAFFQQWAYRDGTPWLEVSYAWDAPAKSMQLVVRQTQLIDAEHPAFDVPLELSIQTDAEPRTERVRVRSELERFEFPLDRAPLGVVLDPAVRLLAVLKCEPRKDE